MFLCFFRVFSSAGSRLQNVVWAGVEVSILFGEAFFIRKCFAKMRRGFGSGFGRQQTTDDGQQTTDDKSYPEGCAAPSVVPCQCNTRECLSKLETTSPRRKIHVTSKSPVGDISVVTLIRTDTTLDHSQKAEKV